MAPLARFDKLAPDKRAAILDAATAEFARHGFEGASINRVIAAAGISKGAIYYYFEDKTDLFATVIEAAVAAMALDWRVGLDATDADGFWAVLHDLLGQSWHYVCDNPHWLDLGRAFVQLPHEMWFEGRIGVFMQRMIGDLTAVVAHGQSLGAVRDDLPADVLCGLLMAAGESYDRWLLGAWPTLDDADRARLYRTGLHNVQRLLLPFPSEMFDHWHPPEAQP